MLKEKLCKSKNNGDFPSGKEKSLQLEVLVYAKCHKLAFAFVNIYLFLFEVSYFVAYAVSPCATFLGCVTSQHRISPGRLSRNINDLKMQCNNTQ